MSDCDRFTRLLLAKGHGFPLFLPSPPVDLPDAVKRNGTQIGDVGIVCNDGSFDPIFNIYRPEGDLANRFGVPSDFKQLPCGQDDILQVPRHPAGTVILNSPASAGAPVLEQALLRLPDGASTRDSRSLPLLRDYAAKHARSWYQFVNDDLERMVGDSGLYLVTGVTKTTSWSIDVGSFAHVAGGEWDEASATINSGPHRSPGEESRENQSVFIRGFKVALRPSGSTDTEDEELSLHSIYHPSDIINKYKFDADPSAMVAVTHDDEWTSVLGEADIKLPDDEDLIARISKKFKTSNSGSTGSWVTPQPFVRGRDLWIHAPARRAVSRYCFPFDFTDERSPIGVYAPTSRALKTVEPTWLPIPTYSPTNWDRSVAFSRDGARIVSGSNDKTVHVRDARMVQAVTDRISFSPDEARIVSGSNDKTVRVLNARTGEAVMEPLQGHTHVVAERGSAPQAAGRHRVMRFLGLQHPADLNAPSGHYQSVHSPGHFDVVSPGHFDVVQHSADVHTAGRSFGNPARTTDPVATTCIPANPDTSGIGVRAAIHVFVNPADLFMPEFNSARRRSNVAPHLASVQQNANGDDSDLGEFQNAKELEVVLEKRNKVERGHSANALEGASRAGHDAIAQLLDHGAAFNAQDGSFDSALAQPEDARPVRAEALAAWGDPQLLLHKHNLKNHVNGILHLLRAHGANLNAVYARTPPAVDVTVQSQAGVHGPLGNRACAYGY